MDEESQTRWYSGRLLYESLHGEEDEPPEEALFEEIVVVFRCEEEDDIVSKLTALAKTHEQEYVAAAGNTVRWVFREILEIQDISAYAIEDGTEVYFRWWHDPSAHDFEIIRNTHEEPWWRDESAS